MLIVKGRGVHLHVDGESLMYIGTFFGADGAAWARKFVELFNAADERTEEEATTVKVPKKTWYLILDTLAATENAPEYRALPRNTMTQARTALKLAQEIDL